MGMIMKDEIRVSKYMSFLLRHDPKGLEVSEEGFVKLSDLLKVLRERFPLIDTPYIRQIVREDSRGRYEIAGDRIRARYGHSMEVKPVFPLAQVERLYHGTTEEAAGEILLQGMKPMERQRVHLSVSVQEATEVGRRRTPQPVILEIDAEQATKEGIVIEKANEKVFVTDNIPPEFIRRLE